MKDSKTRNVVMVEQPVVRDLLVEALRARGFDMTGAVKVEFVGRADGTTAALVENMRAPEDRAATKPAKAKKTKAKAKKTLEETAREVVARVEDDRILEETRRVLSRLGDPCSSQGVTYGALMALMSDEEVEVPQKAFGHALDALRPRVETALAQMTQRGEAELDAHEEDGGEAHWRVVRRKVKARRRDASAATAARDTIDFVDDEPIEKGSPCVWISDVGITATRPDDWPEGLWEEVGMLDEDRLLFDELPPRRRPQSSAAADVLGGEGGVMGRGDALKEGYRDPMLDMDGIPGSWDGE